MSSPQRLCAILTALALSGECWAPVAAMAQAPMQSMQSETVEVAPTEVGPSARVGAAVLNVVYVPGKVITCTAGTLVAGGFMLVTFGSAYRQAVSFFNEGCAGSWVLTPEQVAAAAVAKKAQFGD